MNRTEFIHAQAELTFLDRMIQSEGVGDLTRRSLQSRRDLVASRIQNSNFDESASDGVLVTFRGTPMRGVYGNIARLGMAFDYPANINALLRRDVRLSPNAGTMGQGWPRYTRTTLP